MSEDTQPNEARILPKGSGVPSVHSRPKPIARAGNNRAKGHITMSKHPNHNQQFLRNGKAGRNLIYSSDRRFYTKPTTDRCDGYLGLPNLAKQRVLAHHPLPTRLPVDAKEEIHSLSGSLVSNNHYSTNKTNYDGPTRVKSDAGRISKKQKIIHMLEVKVPEYCRKAEKNSRYLQETFENWTIENLKEDLGATIHEQRIEGDVLRISYYIPSTRTSLVATNSQYPHQGFHSENRSQSSGSNVKLEDLDLEEVAPRPQGRARNDIEIRVDDIEIMPISSHFLRLRPQKPLVDVTQPSRPIRTGKITLGYGPSRGLSEAPQTISEQDTPSSTRTEPTATEYISIDDTPLPSPELITDVIEEVDLVNLVHSKPAASLNEDVSFIEQLSRDGNDRIRRLFVSHSGKTLLAVAMYGGVHVLHKDTNR